MRKHFLIKQINIVFYIILIFTFTYCKKEDEIKKNYFFLDKGYINLESKVLDTLSYFTIFTNLEWKVYSEVTWLTFLPSNNGMGDKEIRIKYEANTNASARYANIDVLTESTGGKKSIEVSQLGIAPFLDIKTSNTIFNYFTHENNILNVVSNVDWKLNSTSTWLQLNSNYGNNSSTISFIVFSNQDTSFRQAEIIATNMRSNEVKKITISQFGIPVPSFFQIMYPKQNDTIIKNECLIDVNKMKIIWSASKDTLGNAIVYDVYLYYPNNTNLILGQNLTDTSLVFNYLNTPSGTYSLEIVAKNTITDKVKKTNKVSFYLSTTEFYSKQTIVAGGNGKGNASNQLNYASDLFVDENETIYIADQVNRRIQKWTRGSLIGQTVAGGVQTNNFFILDNAFQPHSVFVNSLGEIFVSDIFYNRLLKFPANSTGGMNGQTIATGGFYGIFATPNGTIFVCDGLNHCIKKIVKNGNTYETSIVAGVSNRVGSNDLDKFNLPHNLYVDNDENIYVADELNHRIMYWAKGAKTGVLVAGGNGEGSNLNQLKNPRSVIVDACNNMYIVDYGNKRIIKWKLGDKEGKVIGSGLTSPHSMVFKSNENIFISDDALNLIQKWVK